MRKNNNIILLSIFLLFISISVYLYPILAFSTTPSFDFEYINTKDITVSKVGVKSKNINVFNSLKVEDNYNFIETPIFIEEEKVDVNKKVWYLPTINGRVSQYPSINHNAYDITSSNGVYEYIFPIANGKISAIYKDSYGALIIMINHNINGRLYTSQYVHMSSFAEGLYVGKDVTINDVIGRMGSTGISTGVHLHISLVPDCNLGGTNNCKDLNGFFKSLRSSYLSGDRGLGSVTFVPNIWYNR